MNVDKLRDKISSSRKTIEALAVYLGINMSTFYRKINGESDFTRNEIQLVKQKLGLSSSEVEAIFFA